MLFPSPPRQLTLCVCVVSVFLAVRGVCVCVCVSIKVIQGVHFACPLLVPDCYVYFFSQRGEI